MALGLTLWVPLTDAPSASADAPSASASATSIAANAGSYSRQVIQDVVAPGVGTVDVAEVSGNLDGILADFIERSIEDASGRGSLALVLQVDSSQSVIDDDRLLALGERIMQADVPVTMWVGPSGANAKGGIGQLAGLVDDLALAPGSRLGDLGPPIFSPRHLVQPFAEAYERLRDETISSDTAIELGLAREAPTLPFFVLDLPGFRADIDTSGEEPVRVPVSRVRFLKLSLLDQLMHTAASPAVAYLLLIAGAVLLAFELYTAGVGIAGVVGAVSFMLGCYGLAEQPVRAWAVALLVVALFGYCVDIQIGAPRVWTGIATVCVVIGSLRLFEHSSPGVDHAVGGTSRCTARHGGRDASDGPFQVRDADHWPGMDDRINRHGP